MVILKADLREIVTRDY